jgi:PncC family amidohydrolase
VAESLTGGLAASRLTQAEGAADVFAGGVVAYQNEAKRRLLAVSPGPVISRRCALEMAGGVARRFEVDAALSLTGVAGPETQEGQPVGTVWVGWSIDGHPDAVCLHLRDGQPDELRERAVGRAFELIGAALEAADPISVPLDPSRATEPRRGR